MSQNGDFTTFYPKINFFPKCDSLFYIRSARLNLVFSKERRYLSEELTDNDIKLLKKHFNTKLRFFGIGLHKLIDEHKKTPVSILKMIIEEPKRKLDVYNDILVLQGQAV